MEREELKAVIENILFAADQPVSVGQLQDLFAETTEKAVLKSALDGLIREYQSLIARIISTSMLSTRAL